VKRMVQDCLSTEYSDCDDCSGFVLVVVVVGSSRSIASESLSCCVGFGFEFGLSLLLLGEFFLFSSEGVPVGSELIISATSFK